MQELGLLQICMFNVYENSNNCGWNYGVKENNVGDWKGCSWVGGYEKNINSFLMEACWYINMLI